MWGREGLVQVEVHNVEAHITRTDSSKERIEICSIVIEKSSVNEGGNLTNLTLEKTESIRIGHHNTGNFVIEQWFEILDIDESILL